MSSQIYLKITAVIELTGFSRPKVQRDCLRFGWPYTTCWNSPIKLYSLAAIEKTYGISVPAEKVSIIARKLNKTAVFQKGAE
jgi:hypothetical protein